MAQLIGSAADPLWYKDAIIYELHVRAFKDGNADGVGDLTGLIQKMDYLQDLGVTCLWLCNFVRFSQFRERTIYHLRRNFRVISAQ